MMTEQLDERVTTATVTPAVSDNGISDQEHKSFTNTETNCSSSSSSNCNSQGVEDGDRQRTNEYDWRCINEATKALDQEASSNHAMDVKEETRHDTSDLIEQAAAAAVASSGAHLASHQDEVDAATAAALAVKADESVSASAIADGIPSSIQFQEQSEQQQHYQQQRKHYHRLHQAQLKRDRVMRDAGSLYGSVFSTGRTEDREAELAKRRRKDRERYSNMTDEQRKAYNAKRREQYHRLSEISRQKRRERERSRYHGLDHVSVKERNARRAKLERERYQRLSPAELEARNRRRRERAAAMRALKKNSPNRVSETETSTGLTLDEASQMQQSAQEQASAFATEAINEAMRGAAITGGKSASA